MPDHIHLLVSVSEDSSLSLVIGMWKHWLKFTQSIDWQRNFFDHRVRDEENMKQKAEYILQNPVRAGLVENSQDWPYFWIPSEN